VLVCQRISQVPPYGLQITSPGYWRPLNRFAIRRTAWAGVACWGRTSTFARPSLSYVPYATKLALQCTHENRVRGEGPLKAHASVIWRAFNVLIPLVLDRRQRDFT
jgi:hypothetical protein